MEVKVTDFGNAIKLEDYNERRFSVCGYVDY
jgi:hypothetical protein